MKVIGSLLLGYVMGSFSPASLFSKRKHVNLKEEGTKNLGASNVVYIMGRSYGAVVMVIDIFKAFLASRIARALFPKLPIAGLLAGLGAVLGHIFPFYLHFDGGKGLAAFGGMIGAYDGWLLVFYLTVGVGLMLIVNKSVFLPMFAAATFPVIVLLQTGDLSKFLVALAASVVIIVRHWSNLGKVKRGEEGHIRDLLKENVFKKQGEKK